MKPTEVHFQGFLGGQQVLNLSIEATKYANEGYDVARRVLKQVRPTCDRGWFLIVTYGDIKVELGPEGFFWIGGRDEDAAQQEVEEAPGGGGPSAGVGGSDREDHEAPDPDRHGRSDEAQGPGRGDPRHDQGDEGQ